MTSRQPAILEVDSLSKHYADFDLKDVSLSLPKGAIMGLVGTNGAGKSTTIKLILNLIRRDGGSVRIFGKDNIGEEAAVKERIGVVFDECFFHDNLKPSQVSKVMGHIYKDWDEAYFFRLTDRFALPRGKVVKEFSRGMKMKLSIAAALSHHPDLLLLDEPTSGLDPIVRNEILDLFMDFIQDENKSVLLSSHITSDLEKVADYIAYIHGGRILLSDEKDALVERYGVLKGPAAAADQVDPGDVVGLAVGRHGFDALVSDRAAMAKKYPDLLVDAANLEDIILYLVRGNKV